MKSKFDKLAALILVLLGTAHTALTPVLAPKFNLDLPDFAAIGLAFLFLGLINVIRIQTNEKPANILCLVANILGIAWLTFNFIYTRSIEAQGILPFMVLCYLLVRSFSDVIRYRTFN